MKKLFTILFTVFSFMGLFAQISDYELTTFIEDYESLENPIALTNGLWDDPSFTVPFGFNFIFHGDTITTLNTNDDLLGGVLYFGDGTPTGVNIMIPYGSDIIDIGFLDTIPHSTIAYEITGEPGNQIAKVEWTEVGFYGEVEDFNSANNIVSFQAWFYEGTNDIEVRFGPNTVKDPSFHDFGGPMIGMISNFNPNNTSFDTLTTLAGDPMKPEISNTFSNNVSVLEGHPVDGRVYKFGYKFQDFPTSTQPVYHLNNVEIYPTIVEDNLLVNLGEVLVKQDVQLSIHNILGKEILNETINSQQHSINLYALEKGNYFVKIQIGNQYEVRKIMKL